MKNPGMKTRDTSEKYPRATVRQVGLVAALFIAYVLVLLALLDIRPLWLDEVIQFKGTCGGNWQTLIQYVLRNPAGAPLGYLGQHWIMSLAGCGVRTARVLSVVAGAASLALLLVVGMQLRLPRSTVLLGASLWAVCPLAVRYSLEGRPYMLAVLFALAAVATQLQLGSMGKIYWAVALAACLAAAVYTQLFAVFSALGFSAWNVWQARSNRRYVLLTLAAYTAAGLAFIPWFVAAHSYWPRAIEHIRGTFVWTPSLLLLLFRECVGDGYAAAVPVAVFAGAAVFAIAKRPFLDPRLPVLGAILAAVVLGIAGDAQFAYFFAIRQVIYMVPFLLLLAAEGVTLLWANGRYRVAAAVLVAVFAGAAIAKSYGYLTDRREDWNRLSAHLSEAVGSGCLLVPEGDEVRLYAVFQPQFMHQLCDASLSSNRIVIPSHSYTDPRAVRTAEDALSAKGMSSSRSEQVGFGKIEVFTKP
jgi:uncharacterized membrane protein